ncbi:RhoGAP domain-containing protein [Planoprotostelium fungivorum]|uniref:RhoGAP domain-containing protein n=1 Tax=Planoprotostelium fungivorum TaxID=1890364 RepID=A0A2P6N536_9EUKA|nr:RhoGAP domain-containing protein [Planoprotostelium fungivorum]
MRRATVVDLPDMNEVERKQTTERRYNIFDYGASMLSNLITNRPCAADLVTRGILPSTGQEKLPLTATRAALLIGVLENKGPAEEGVFRISPSAVEQREWWSTFVSGRANFDKADPFIVAASLKMYIREQEQPILSSINFDKLLQGMEKDDFKEMGSTIEILPEIPRGVFLYLFETLRLISNSPKTRMSADNLGVVWGPNLIRTNPSNILHDTTQSKELVSYMITHIHDISGHIPSYQVILPFMKKMSHHRIRRDSVSTLRHQPVKQSSSESSVVKEKIPMVIVEPTKSPLNSPSLNDDRRKRRSTVNFALAANKEMQPPPVMEEVSQQNKGTGLTMSPVKAGQLIYSLEKRVKPTDNLFRVSPTGAETTLFWENYLQNIHIIAACLKRYFRDQDEPIVKREQRKLFSSALEIESDEEAYRRTASAFELMSDDDRTIFIYLLNLLRQVGDQSQNFGADGIAVVWAPNLFRYDQEDSSGIKNDMQESVDLLSFLINHWKSLQAFIPHFGTTIDYMRAQGSSAPLISGEANLLSSLNLQETSFKRRSNKLNAFLGNRKSVGPKPKEEPNSEVKKSSSRMIVAMGNRLSGLLSSRPSADTLLATRVLPSSGLDRVKLELYKVERLVREIERRGLEKEGIFRLSVGAMALRSFWEKFRAEGMDMESEDVLLLASALKLYIRDQEDTLIPPNVWMDMNKATKVEDTVENICKVLAGHIEKVSTEKRSILLRLLQLLDAINQKSEINLMNSNNLGVVWGPNLYCADINSPTVISDTEDAKNLTGYIIANLQSLRPHLSTWETDVSRIRDSQPTPATPEVPKTNPLSSSANLMSSFGNSVKTAITSVPSMVKTAVTPVSSSPSLKTDSPPSTPPHSANANISASSSAPVVTTMQLPPIVDNYNGTSTSSGNNLNAPPITIARTASFSAPEQKSRRITMGFATLREKLSGSLTPRASIQEMSISSPVIHNAPQGTSTAAAVALAKKERSAVAHLNEYPQDPMGKQVNTSRLRLSVMLTKWLRKKKKIQNDDVVNFVTLLQEIVAKPKRNVTVFVYLVFTKRQVFLLQIDPLAVLTQMLYTDIKEVAMDSSMAGLFLLVGRSSNANYLSAGKTKGMMIIIDYLQRGRDRMRTEISKGQSVFAITKYTIMGSEAVQDSPFSNKLRLGPVLEQLAMAGFSETDIWNGQPDLQVIVKQNNLVRAMGTGNMHIVEFILPDSPEFKGLHYKSFNIDKNHKCTQVLRFLCEKMNLSDSSKYSLATLGGRGISENEPLASYGLGSIFESWQLKLELKGNPGTGMFNVEVLLPPEEWAGLSKKVIRVDAYMPVHMLINHVCAKVNVKRQAHYYELRYEGKTLGDQSYLADLGLGIRIRTIQVQIHAKTFPTGNDPVKDTEMISGWLRTSFYDHLWESLQSRRAAQISDLCSTLVDGVFDRAISQIERVSDLATRIASLSTTNRDPFFRFLRTKEREDIAQFGRFIVMKKIADVEMSLPGYTPVEEEEEEEAMVVSIPAAPAPPPPPPMPSSGAKKLAVPPTNQPAAPVESLASRLQAELKAGGRHLRKVERKPVVTKERSYGMETEAKKILDNLKKRNGFMQGRAQGRVEKLE